MGALGGAGAERLPEGQGASAPGPWHNRLTSHCLSLFENSSSSFSARSLA